MNVVAPVIVAAKENHVRRGRSHHGHAAAIVADVTYTTGKYDQKREGK